MSIVKSLSVGNGDMFFIRHNHDSFTIIDCCMPDEFREEIIDEIRQQSRDKMIVRFISTHPDQDHICGLADLDEEFNLRNFYCVANDATKGDGATKDFLKYCDLRDSDVAFHVRKGTQRKWLNEGDGTRGSSGLNILWPDPANHHYKSALEEAHLGKCPNNISLILRYAINGGPSIMWMGDLDTEFMREIEAAVSLPRTDILFAPHHGRDSGRVPASWLNRIQPKLIVIGEASSGHLHYYPGYDTITQNSAGDITFECGTGKADIYVSNINYDVEFLGKERKPHTHGKYLGTLSVD